MTRREEQKLLTSKAILSASLIVFSDLDFNTATFSDISKIAKVTNGLIVQRFGSKEALFLQLINENITSKAPSFDNCETLNDAILLIISFVKNIAISSFEAIKFGYKVTQSYASIPQKAKDAFLSLYINTKLERIFSAAISEGKINAANGFEAFINFFSGCCELTYGYYKADNGLPSNDAYLSLFKKMSALDGAKSASNSHSHVFDNISDNSLQLYNVFTWYCEIGEETEPRLFFPAEVLARAGISKNITPEKTYRFILDRVDNDDVAVIRDAIHKMYLGQYVEFEYHWRSPTMKTLLYRCSGKRTSQKNGVSRFEGLLQNITPFKMLRNTNKTRNFYLNLLAPDYEYVSYIRLGKTADDDYVEDFKASEFLNKLTDNWGHTNNFMDRLSILVDKVMTGEEHLRFAHKDNREILLSSLRTNDRFKTNFKLRHYGVIYNYETIFFADREEDKTITGLICGIRLVNSASKLRERIASHFETFEQTKDRKIAELLLSNQEAAFLINTKNHTFEVIKSTGHFDRRNDYIPDFEAFIKTYIKRDVYFEDVESMLEVTSLSALSKKLETVGAYTFTYRDISRGEPYYYIMRASKGDDDNIGIVITNINDEYHRANQEKGALEDSLRFTQEELHEKTLAIERTNSVIVDLLGDVIESFREDGIKNSHKFKGLTYILGCQIMEDHPELKLDRKYISQISEASVLHDIGKITIPDAILFKNEKLSKEEYEIVKSHITNNEKLLRKLKSIYNRDSYRLIMDVCKYHHERYDGSGYPDGLKGDEIPLSAQIVGLVDAYVALVSKRVYRDAYEAETAVDMILSGECGSFNPIILDSFKRCARRLLNYLIDPEKEEKDFNLPSSLDSHKEKAILNSQTVPVVAYMAEQMPGGFFIYKNDASGTLLYFNNFMVKYFNCSSRDEFVKYVNNSFRGIVHADDYEKTINTIKNQVNESADDLEHIQYRIVCKNGETKIFDHYGHVTNSDNLGEVSYAFVQDITEQERIIKATQATVEKVIEKPVAVKEPIRERVKTLDGTRILVVDDNDLSRFITKDSLVEEGANVSDFSTGKDALEIIQSVKPFDIILIDLIMPEMDGLELTRAIREWEEDKDIRVPIVIVTGEAGDVVTKRCIDAGANGCMSKPLVISELARLLIMSMKEHATRMNRKLTSTIQKANTDALTHVKNRTAYAEKIDLLEQAIRNNPYQQFGILGADINNLKVANDQYGHDIGDMYIKNCCKMLCDTFIHSPVYRTGGDEFAVILEGSDLVECKQLLATLTEVNHFRSGIEDYEKGKAHIAFGCAIYNPEIDDNVDDVIKRADEEMYKNKQIEKQRVAGSFLKD